MENNSFTLLKSLRFANHDFVNHLQLIHLYLEVGQIDEAKNCIKEISKDYKSLSILNKLSLPKTIEWIYLFRWRYPSIQLTINSYIEDVIYPQNDDEIVEYLEQTINSVYNGLDPYSEHHLLIEIKAIQKELLLHFHLEGKWETNVVNQIEKTNLKVKTIEMTQQSWKYELTSE